MTSGLVVTRCAGQHVVTLAQGWFAAGSYRLFIQATTARRYSRAVAERLLVLAPTSPLDTDRTTAPVPAAPTARLERDASSRLPVTTGRRGPRTG